MVPLWVFVGIAFEINKPDGRKQAHQDHAHNIKKKKGENTHTIIQSLLALLSALSFLNCSTKAARAVKMWM